MSICQKVPTIVVIYLDRPAVLNVIFGRAKPEGKLPFELPSSMEAFRNQKADVPHDSENSLYPFGFGLTYSAA